MIIRSRIDQNFFSELERGIAEASVVFSLANTLTIQLVFSQDSAIDAAWLTRLMTRLAGRDLREYKQVYLSVEGQENLSMAVVMLLLGNNDFLTKMQFGSFSQLIVSSDELAQFALHNEIIKTKLNACRPTEDRQTFFASCAARSLMKMMHENNLLSDADYTRSKELEIYRQIWLAPGKPACPKKIIEFIRRVSPAQHLNVICVEMTGITHQLLRDIDGVLDGTVASNPVKSVKAAQFKSAFTLFQSCSPDRYIKTDVVKENLFPGGYLLLMERNPNDDAHICLASKKVDGKFSVYDPADGSRMNFGSFNDYCQERKERYLGVSMNIRPCC